MESTNRGGGVFSYTFRRGDAEYVWGIRTNYGSIQLLSHGVLEVWEPPGWAHTVRTDGLITWTVTNGVAFLDEPVVFSVRSCLTEARTYAWGTTDPVSIIIGGAYTLPDHRFLAGGYQLFDFVGPALPHLRIEGTATNVTVRWSGAGEAVQLQSCAQLGAPGCWSAVTNAPAIVDSEFAVQLPRTESQTFFRLVTTCTH